MPVCSHAWILAGATATGKTDVAQILAEQTACAILSADAMLVYRDMNIGTAKPTPAMRGNTPYYGLDLVTPAEPFSTGLWLVEAARALHNTTATTNSSGLIITGGTGLYLKALTAGLDSNVAQPEAREIWQKLFEQEGVPALHAALAQRDPQALQTLSDPANPRRLIRALEHLDTHGSLPQQWRLPAVASAPAVILRLPRATLHTRIQQRVEQMFARGLIEETRALRQTYPLWSATAGKAIGYAEVCDLLDGKLSQPEALERIVIRTRQLAKRQETWLRHQLHAVWLDITNHESPPQIAQRVLALWRNYGPTTIVSP